MKKILCFLCAIVTLTTLCSCAGHIQQGIPDEKLQTSQDNNFVEDSESPYIGGGINVLKGNLNSFGEILYISRGGEEFIYDGSAIDTILTFYGNSHVELQAKIFVLVDGVLQLTTLEDGSMGYFHQFSFSANNNDEESFTIPISFEPIFKEVKDSYDIAFCMYMYNAGRLFDSDVIETSRYALRCDISFLSINYKLIINDRSLIKAENVEIPSETQYFKYEGLSQRTEGLIKLSLSEVPSEDMETVRKASESDIMSLYLYVNDESEYQTIVFIDGEYYYNFCDIGYLKWFTKTDNVACAQIPCMDLGKGVHTIDVISLNLNSLGGEFCRFVVSVE